MLVSKMLDYIRLEVHDKEKSRFTDEDLILLLRKSLRRLEHIIFRNDIQQGKITYGFTTIPGISDYDLPDDYMTDVGLYKGNGVALVKKTDQQWQTIVSTGEATVYIVRENSIYIASTPKASTAMTLVYWPRLDVDDLALTDDMPYAGKFDDMIADYVSLRAKNIDEMSLDFDTQLLSDLENQVLTTYGTVAPITVKMRGWCP